MNYPRKPSIDWGTNVGRYTLDQEDVWYYAEWICDNLTKKNKKLLVNILRPFTFRKTYPAITWLNPDIAVVLGFVIEDRQSALQKAVRRGDCPAKNIPLFSRYFHYKVIGAAMCELWALYGITLEDFSE